MKDTWYIFILDILLSALKGCSQVPKGVTCQAFNCALVQCHLTPDTALVTFHPWKRELWPSEEWPLILTGPNGAWRTASDRRQMETQHACKDRRTCAGGQRDMLMEWTGLCGGPRSDGRTAGTGPGRAQLTQETAETCRSCLFPCLLTQQTQKRRRVHAFATCKQDSFWQSGGRFSSFLDLKMCGIFIILAREDGIPL